MSEVSIEVMGNILLCIMEINNVYFVLHGYYLKYIIHHSVERFLNSLHFYQ